MRSVNRTGGHYPLAPLAGHGCYPVEVGVVMEDGQTLTFGSRRHQKVGDLAAPLVLRREQALHVARSDHVVGSRLDELERIERLEQSVPLGSTSSRKADLQVTDPRARELARGRKFLDGGPHHGDPEAGED